MARVLIVGCGCRGRALAGALAADGHAVRGTTRQPASRRDIEAAGAEAVIADPDRLATLMPHIEGVSALCWLMGTARGDAEAVAALHGPRLRSLVEALVDTHVRGVVYEAAGEVPAQSLERGAAIVEELSTTFRMPVAVVDEPPERHEVWLATMRTAVERVLAA